MTPSTRPDVAAAADVIERPSKAVMFGVYTGYLLILVLLLVGGAEMIVRAKGYKPWRAENDAVASIVVNPGGRLFQPDAELGYTHLPGRFDVTLGVPEAVTADLHGDQTWRFTMTHLPNTLRITRPPEREAQLAQGEGLWIFGCSFTHGWSVNDEETYPWRLQQRFPEFNVVNFGVSGYGEIHSLLQFREALKHNTPRVAVLAYADFHDVRNTFSRSRRKLIAPWSRLGPLVQPYARIDAAGTLQYGRAAVEYPEFPLQRRLALAHFAEIRYNDRELRSLDSRRVSEALILEMSRLAAEHGVRFIVATINGEPMREFFTTHAIANVDIAVDATKPENTNLPFDSHPSAFAHQQYADRLAPVLEPILTRTN